jgi:hypothetical protein
MPRPTVLSATLAAVVAAELAVGTLLVAPTAFAEDAPAPAADPGAASTEPEIRTGRTDTAPEPAGPVEVPDAAAGPVRTGRVGDVPALAGEPAEPAPSAPPAESAPESPTRPAPTPDRESPAGPSAAPSSPTPGPATPDTGAPLPPAAAVPAAPAPLPAAHTVVPGDNLWEIAAAHLALATGRSRHDLGALDIAPYWTRVCLLNRAHLRSGDVSLIYTDEVIDLPTP